MERPFDQEREELGLFGRRPPADAPRPPRSLWLGVVAGSLVFWIAVVVISPLPGLLGIGVASWLPLAMLAPQLTYLFFWVSLGRKPSPLRPRKQRSGKDDLSISGFTSFITILAAFPLLLEAKLLHRGWLLIPAYLLIVVQCAVYAWELRRSSLSPSRSPRPLRP